MNEAFKTTINKHRAYTYSELKSISSCISTTFKLFAQAYANLLIKHIPFLLDDAEKENHHFLNFPACFLILITYPDLNCNCSNIMY